MSDDAPLPPSRPTPLPASAISGAAIEFMQLVDGVFVRWRVHEVDAHVVPGTRGANCLLFVCEDVIRRVWNYPADWRSLGETELALLSWSR